MYVYINIKEIKVNLLWTKQGLDRKFLGGQKENTPNSPRSSFPCLPFPQAGSPLSHLSQTPRTVCNSCRKEFINLLDMC